MEGRAQHMLFRGLKAPTSGDDDDPNLITLKKMHHMAMAPYVPTHECHFLGGELPFWSSTQMFNRWFHSCRSAPGPKMPQPTAQKTEYDGQFNPIIFGHTWEYLCVFKSYIYNINACEYRSVCFLCLFPGEIGLVTFCVFQVIY